MLTISVLTATAQERINLYPDHPEWKILGGKEINDVPHIEYYAAPANKKNGAAVLVCPGGGYTHLALGHEGKDVAEFFNANGFDAIVLHYRLNGGPQAGATFPAQYNDVTLAMQIVKSKAKGWGFSPDKVGVLGFSAGGHLASMLTTMHVAAEPNAKSAPGRFSSRPAFSILVYPVISLSESFRHKGSANNLLGADAPKEKQDSLSTQNRVTEQTPPTMLIHASDDKGVPVENSLVFYKALLQHNIPATMHIYDHGGHGFGMAPKDPVLNTWPALVVNWINGMLNK